MLYKAWFNVLSSFFFLLYTGGEFTFDGPFSHEVLMGGLVDLPCFVSTAAKRLVLDAFSGLGSHRLSLRWVHRRFDRVVDPWTGDGRRSYLEMGITQSSDGIAQSMGIFNVPWVPGVGLRVLAVNPSDSGFYACLLSKLTFDQGLTVDMKNATLLSIHSIRVTESRGFGKSETSTNTTSEGAALEAMGARNDDEKGTLFDAWTWQITSLATPDSDMTIFKSEFHL